MSDTPWLDARILASFVTGLDASALVAYGETTLTARQRDHLFALAVRRAAGEPAAYLVGYKEFCGLQIAVDKRVLVPRPETEEVVLAAAERRRGCAIEALDLGTGSGAIACALAHLLPRARIVASDVSEAALSVAQANVRRLGLAERVELVHSDLFESLGSRRFDVIIANLPYVGRDDAHARALSPGVRVHEPEIALFAGGDGLQIYRRVLAGATNHLRAAGALYCECSPLNARQLAAAAAVAFPGATVAIGIDAAGLQRTVIVELPAQEPGES